VETTPPSTTGPRSAFSRVPGQGHGLAVVVGAILIGFWFFAPIRQTADPTLDTSNYASFAYFTASGFQFGSDVLHVGGPYGFVHYGFVYGGHLFWERFALELLTKLVLGLLVVWLCDAAAATGCAGPGWRCCWR
jgi:hypothetical protein